MSELEKVSDEVLEEMATAFAKKTGEGSRLPALLRELIELRRMNEWVSVTPETMPPLKRCVIVWCPENKCKFAASWNGEYWSIFGGGKTYHEFTHWQPTPTAPEEAVCPSKS